MNITPEQIPDEAARAALEKYYRMTGIKADSCIPYMKSALAAALPVLLGEPVAWMANNGDVMSARSRSSCTRASSLSRYHIALVRTPETPNAHP